MSKKNILLPKIDIVFKMLFGDARNVDILKSFLASVIDINKEDYEEIEFLNPILPKDNFNDKTGVVDVLVKTNQRKLYILKYS